MKYEELVRKCGQWPVIQAENLTSGVFLKLPPLSIKVQLSRWQKSGKIIQLKRGVYVLPEMYRKTAVYEPYLAWILKNPSYVSLEKALEYHDLIPEGVAVYTCVTTKRPGQLKTPLGV